MLRPSKMEKITLIVNNKYLEDAMGALSDVGVIQIEQVPEDVLSVMGPIEARQKAKIESYAQRFRSLEGLMYHMPSESKFTFSTFDELVKAADSVAIDERVVAIKRDMDSMDVKMKSHSSSIALLGLIGDFPGDISVLHTKNIISFIAYGEQINEMLVELAKKASDTAVIRLNKVAIVSIRRKDSKEFATVVEKFKVKLDTAPEMKGSVSFNLEKENASLQSLQQQKGYLHNELEKISETSYPIVSALREQFDIEAFVQETYAKLGATKEVFAVHGWIQRADMPKLEGMMKKVAGEHYVLHVVETDESPPTRMLNPAGFRLYEAFIKFYSIPKGNEIDPTMVFAIAFPIFFGFMIGDAGYGVSMLALSLWLIYRTSHMPVPPKKSHIPKAITGFLSNIVGVNGLKLLAKSILPGAIIAIVFGLLFNEFFGFQLPYAAPFKVESGLSKLLLISGYAGVAMVSLGFILGFANKLILGERKHAAAKLGWLAMAWGFVLFGLNILYKANIGASNPAAILSYVLLIGGAATVLMGEGGKAIMEIPSIISHILSYTRLVGILLASVILAEVIDFIFLSGINHSLLFGIVGVVILIIGQLFNFTIALFEPGIQGARLLYVEFFSKFYEGNGKVFKPFFTERKRTLSKFKY